MGRYLRCVLLWNPGVVAWFARRVSDPGYKVVELALDGQTTGHPISSRPSLPRALTPRARCPQGKGHSRIRACAFESLRLRLGSSGSDEKMMAMANELRERGTHSLPRPLIPLRCAGSWPWWSGAGGEGVKREEEKRRTTKRALLSSSDKGENKHWTRGVSALEHWYNRLVLHDLYSDKHPAPALKVRRQISRVDLSELRYARHRRRLCSTFCCDGRARRWRRKKP